MKTKLYDVFVVECASRKIESVAGTNLPEAGSFHTVDKRVATVSERINDRYSVEIAPAGKYSKGDVLPARP